MKINSLKLTNFTKHEACIFNFTKKKNFIHGRNNQGKSSIKNAIAWVLTGKTDTITSKDKYNLLTTYGQANTVVTLNMDELGNITRTIPHGLKISSMIPEDNLTNTEKYLSDKLNLTQEQILCAIYSSNFINLPSNEQKNFIFNILNFKFTKENIKEEFINYCKSIPIEDYLIHSIWEYIENNKSVFNFDSQSIIEDIEDYYKGENRSLKKDIKRLEHNINITTLPKLPNNVTIDKKKEIANRIQELTLEKENLIVSKTKLELYRKEIQELTLVAAKKDEIQDIPESLIDINKNIESNTSLIQEIKTKITELTTNCNISKDLLIKMKNFNGDCPVFNNIKCNLKDEFITVIINNTNKEIERLSKEIDENKVKQTELENTIKLYKEKKDKKEKYNSLYKEVIEAYKKLENKENVDPKINEIQEKIDNINNKIVQGNTLLNNIITYETIEKSILNNKRELQSCIDKQMKCEIIIKAFQVKGIKSNLIIKESKVFLDKINETLAKLTNNKYQLEFNIDEDFVINVISDKIRRNLNIVSTSEKMRIGIAIQDAIAKFTNFKLLICDDLEILDKENKKLFINCINEIESFYDTILMIITSDKVTNNPDENINIINLNGNANG